MQPISKRVAFLVLAGSALARPVAAGSITLYADAPPPGVTNIVGNTTTSAPGFPTGSWQGAANSPGQKTELYIAPTQLFGHAVAIGDIQSVSYWTNKGTTAAAPDWTFYFYTAKQASGNGGSFYHTRLNSEPYLTNTPFVAANTWHQWSTNDPTHPMRFYDTFRDGGIFGTYTDPTLADIQAGPVTWPSTSTTVDYRSEQILAFSIQTGSAWANGFTGLVDGLTITLSNHEVGTVNFEAAAVPEPATVLSLSAAGLCALISYVRRRRAK